MKMETIRQTIVLKASPHEVFEVLLDPAKHAELTGEKANIIREVGREFNVYGSYIKGMILELVPDKKIVQSWRTSDWPLDHFSEVTILLEPFKGGTRLHLTQTGVPEEKYGSTEAGWKERYWDKMRKMFEEEKNNNDRS